MSDNKNKTSKSFSRRTILKVGGALTATALTTMAAPSVQASNPTIKIGFISPQTGPLAAFGAADKFVLDDIRKALENGIVSGGKTYRVEIISKDSQSNPNRVAEVASNLILRDKIDIMVASSTGDTVNPAADQCEINGIPCVTTNAPWEAYFFGRGGDPKKGFDWTYHFFWGQADLLNVFTDMWETANTNKKVGLLFANDVEGTTLSNKERGFPNALEAKNFDFTLPGLFAPFTDDFSSAISSFKKAEVDIITGAVTPPDFTTFWSQAGQQGLRNKLKFMSIAKAMLFPAAIEALGDSGIGITTEVWWSPSHPFKSGLTNQTAAEFAAAYTAKTGAQWTQPLGFQHAVLEVAIDCLKRSGDPKNPEAVRKAIIDTDYKSMVGQVSWKFGDKRNPVRNVCTTPLVGGQWKKGSKFPYDLAIVNNKQVSSIPLTGKLKLLN